MLKEEQVWSGIAKDWRSQLILRIETWPISQEENLKMKTVFAKGTLELEIQIEELETKIAPDGGETVLPLPIPKGHHR